MNRSLQYCLISANSFLFGLWGYWHCGHSWPIVPPSGDSEEDCGEADGMQIGRGNRSSRRKPAPVPLLSITKSHMTRPGFESGPATNRLSYGTPLISTKCVVRHEIAVHFVIFLMPHIPSLFMTQICLPTNFSMTLNWDSGKLTSLAPHMYSQSTDTVDKVNDQWIFHFIILWGAGIEQSV
jgi:hypothetical protein